MKESQIPSKIISVVVTVIIFFMLCVLLYSANTKIDVYAIINHENKFLKENRTILYADDKYSELKLPTLVLSPKAKELWVAFYNLIETVPR